MEERLGGEGANGRTKKTSLLFSAQGKQIGSGAVLFR